MCHGRDVHLHKKVVWQVVVDIRVQHRVEEISFQAPHEVRKWWRRICRKGQGPVDTVQEPFAAERQVDKSREVFRTRVPKKLRGPTSTRADKSTCTRHTPQAQPHQSRLTKVQSPPIPGIPSKGLVTTISIQHDGYVRLRDPRDMKGWHCRGIA